MKFIQKNTDNRSFNEEEENITLKRNLLLQINTAKDRIIQNASKEIELAKAIISHNESDLIYPNTINVIQGKSGTHKSRLVELICACLLSQDVEREELCGFRTYKERDYKVVYVDTERNIYEQFPKAVRRIRRLSGQPTERNQINLDPVSIIDIQRKSRLSALKTYLEELRKVFNGHIFIILDVASDCISSFNDVNESLELIDSMNELINAHDATFLTVIHENPGGNDKARGHLGTELYNKASTAMQIGFESKEEEIIKLKFIKTRNSAKPKPIAFEFDEENECLMLADPSNIKKVEAGSSEIAPLESVKAFLTEYLSESKMKSEVFDAMMDHFGCKARVLEQRVSKIINEKHVLIDASKTRFKLEKSKEGKQIMYSLIPLE